MATISRGAAAGHRRRTGGALFCSERHVRTLLRQAQEAGWLSWQASSGRGKRGQLLFHKTPESLRNEMMEQALNNGQQQTALELAQLAPVELKALLHPFLGGQWQNNTPTLRIPYYRPLEPLRPGFLPAAPSSIWPDKSMPG